MEAELQDEEGDIQTIWLNTKEKAAPVLWKLPTHIPHITDSELRAGETRATYLLRHKASPENASTRGWGNSRCIYTGCHARASHGGRCGFILPRLKLLKPTAILYQQQCQLLWQAARQPRAPHVQLDQADANKTACTASCPQARQALPLLQDGAAVCLTTNSFTFPLHFYFSFGVGENTPHPSPETTALFATAMGWVSI